MESLTKKRRFAICVLVLWIIGMSWLNLFMLERQFALIGQHSSEPTPLSEYPSNSTEESQAFAGFVFHFSDPMSDFSELIIGNFSGAMYLLISADFPSHDYYNNGRPLQLDQENSNISLIFAAYYDESGKNYSVHTRTWPYFLDETYELSENWAWLFYLEISYLDAEPHLNENARREFAGEAAQTF